MPKTRTLLWLAILCFSPDFLCGCTCASIPSFIENIHKETRIFQVEVLAHGALPVNDIRQFLTKKHTSKEPAQSVNAPAAPLLPYSYTSYTLLKIIDPIMGESSIGDTIVFFNGESSLCLGSLENRAPGTKYVLKVSESNEEALGNDAKSYLKKNGLLDKDLDTGRIYTSEICHEWILNMEDQMVVGSITPNKTQQYIEKLNKDKLTSEERQELIKKLQNTQREKMPYLELVGLIARIKDEGK